MKTIEQASLESANKAFGLVEDMTWDMDKEFHNYHQEAFRKGAEFAQQWISVEDELPEKLKMVLIKCNNNGKVYTTTAQFVPEKSILASDFLADEYDEDCTEYDEWIDDYYVISGWWEHQTEVDVNWKISSEVTHWRPIDRV